MFVLISKTNWLLAMRLSRERVSSIVFGTRILILYKRHYMNHMLCILRKQVPSGQMSSSIPDRLFFHMYMYWRVELLPRGVGRFPSKFLSHIYK